MSLRFSLSSLPPFRRNAVLFLIPASRPLMAPTKVVAEYAKSGRSSCKSCSKAIAAGALRLGSSANDPRGFDLVRWFHVDCFPAASLALAAADEIVGFSSLKDHEKDALRKLEPSASSNQITEEVHKRCRGAYVKMEAKSSKKPKICIADEAGSEDLVEERPEGQKDATLPPKWIAFRTIIFNEKEDGFHDSERIAAFDFDGCLVNTSVKRIGPDAWSLMYPSIPEKLQELYKGGYKLVIFTNESNIERWKNKRQQAVESKIGRLENFIKCVKVPIQVFIACGLGKNKDGTDDPFRKPQPGMWKLMEEHFNSSIAVDMDQSFYVGDAAGRTNDHSDADIKFAKDQLQDFFFFVGQMKVYRKL
ncbi:polynucleotide 3'-phosphatase ZDP-like isoform X3 [Musa acuminata AAA Group]|uniref:polynucleotide 3'-phosphatase ZDP-like isoform X3 n=1 Tax=Musa acuminata AAA Group TaxID=214697 RepID=UPI0031E41780